MKGPNAEDDKGLRSLPRHRYRGRLGIFELLVMNDALREELLRRRGASDLRAIAVAGGMQTLREDGIRLIADGRTTPEEVVRVTKG